MTTTFVAAGRQAPAVWSWVSTIRVSDPWAGVNDPLNPAAFHAALAFLRVIPTSVGTVLQVGGGVGGGVGVGVGFGVDLGVGVGVLTGFGVGVGVGFGVVTTVTWAAVAVGVGVDLTGVAMAASDPVAVGAADGDGSVACEASGVWDEPSTPPIGLKPPPSVSASIAMATRTTAAAIDGRRAGRGSATAASRGCPTGTRAAA